MTNPLASQMLLERMVEPGESFSTSSLRSAMKSSGRGMMDVKELLSDAAKHGIVQDAGGGRFVFTPAPMKNPDEKVLVTLAYIGDGYLAAAEYGMLYEDYFVGLEDEDGFELEYANLPIGLAKNIIMQGTSEQFYSDGYEAADAVAPFLDE